MKKPGFLLVLAFAAFGQQPYTVWQEHLGGIDSPQYSGLSQINKTNVSQLQQMWFYPSGDNGSRYGFNTTVVDGLLYLLGVRNTVTAVKADTGEKVWEHQLGDSAMTVTHRGVAYWESNDRKDRRILFSSGDQLQALDARTGQPILSFGDNGKVNLRIGLGRDTDNMRRVQSADPGRIFENLLILGSAPGEEYESPPGDLRAFNVITGKQVWAFHTVPHPGEPGYDTWPPDAWKYVGGTNTWGEISIDEKRGIAYFPLGSPTYDFYGADRRGSNLYSDCLLALDARTGKYLWHFQMVHHDLWDYDATASPKLLTIKHDGKDVDIVAQTTKQGFLFVFDRVTGKPIWPIEERRVPKSDVPGEESWPTQPFPTVLPPFSRQKFTVDDVNPYISDPAELARFKDAFSKARNLGLFTPPSLIDTMEAPGNNGGANFGSTAVDPPRGWLYVVSKENPSMLRLEPQPGGTYSVNDPPAQVGRTLYMANCQQCHKADLSGNTPEVPALTGLLDSRTAEEVKDIVTRGEGQMPAFSKLTDIEKDRLITFLRNPAAANAAGGRGGAARPAPPVKLTPGVPQRFWTGYNYINSRDGYPATSPPFFTMTAYDLNEGKLKWTIPVGEVPALVARGIRHTGSIPTRGGPVVTAGGLVFAPSQSDRKIYAFDKVTGETVWEKQLPAAPEGVPSIFEIDGREFLVVAAREARGGRSRARDTAPADANQAPVQGYYAFALPK